MTRVGQGFDVHRFDDQRPLIIGGVHIDGHAGLAGHSDADVLSHAIADALLGAARLGDLGSNFPADDEWRDASSLDILAAVARLLTAAGYEVSNIDATVIAERPRLASYRPTMEATIARALEIEIERVSVKVTSTDGLGAIGRGEGIASSAVVVVSSVG